MPRPPLPPAEPMRLESLCEIARGGMGSVELTRVVEGRLLGQVIAIKRLHANIAEDPEFVSMFLDEAWITAALKHPNVAQVMAWGSDEQGPFLAIELVQGVSLSRLLKEAQTNQEPFAERTVAFICSQICGGLTVAHSLTAPDGTALSVVHRDLTPANVLVSFDGSVKIIDFGIAKAEERITHTRTGQLKGKPSYMAPEQQRGGVVDHRADLFAFGVTMFELLAGRRPWTAKGAFDVMMEISGDPHPDLGELRRGLNPEFVTIAHRCLEKKPEARFNSAAEIKALLDGWLAAKGFAADDQQSLAQFVQRNSQPQVKWWQEALRGEHANKKKAPTFKELEERIDEEREKRDKAAKRAAPPLRRAAGTIPMPAYQGPPSSTRGPASDPNAPVSSGPMSSGPMSGGPGGPMSGSPMSVMSGVPISSGSSGPMSTAPMSPHPPSTGAPRSGQPQSTPQPPSVQPPSVQPPSVQPPSVQPPSRQPSSLQPAPLVSSLQPAPLVSSLQPAPMAHSGLMAPPSPGQPPASMAAPFGLLPPSGSSPPRSLAGTEFFSPASQRWSSPGPPPSVQVPQGGTESGTVPMSPAMLHAARQTGSGLVPPPPPVAPAKRSRVGLIVLLVALPIAGGTAAWLLRDQLFGSPEKAPATGPAKPAGKAR